MGVGRTIGKLAFSLAQLPGGGTLVVAATRFLPRLLPGVVRVDAYYVRLRHPAPILPGHELLLPRRYIADFSDDSAALTAFLRAIEDITPPDGDWHLLTNLGVRQDVRLLHVHIFPRPAAGSEWVGSDSLVGSHAETRRWCADSLPTGGSVAIRPRITGSKWEHSTNRA